MRGHLLVAALIANAACGDNHAAGHVDAPPQAQPDARLEGFDKPDLVCPGDPQCATTGDGVLKVGASAKIYTPQDFETYTDENGDREWESAEPYTDKNGNGKFDAVWLFGGARAAEGVTTDVEARALAFVEGDVTVVIVYLDALGILAGDIDAIRRDPALADLHIDHIVIGATHGHDTPDIVGLWGPNLSSTGRARFVIDSMHAAAVAAVKEALQSARPATMKIATSLLINDPADHDSKTDNFNEDIRDPVIFDPTLTVAQFTDASTGATIGTLVNWADHPEVAHFSETDPATITAHYPHYLRAGIEHGVTKSESVFANGVDLPGLGGVTVFVQGALGGQIGSIRSTHPLGPSGEQLHIENDAMEQALGKNAAAKALTALATSGETVADLPLACKSAAFAARIDNTGFQVEFLLGVIAPHPLVGYNPDLAIDTGNVPWLPLRSTFVQIGPLGIVTVPGELHPELWVGGYDGSWSWGWPLYDPAKPNGPDFANAPKPPYMRDLVLGHPGVKYPIVAGLAEDYIGYIVPAYNYVLATDAPYINEADGDHYEETYSLGPDVERQAIDPILQLLAYRR